MSGTDDSKPQTAYPQTAGLQTVDPARLNARLMRNLLPVSFLSRLFTRTTDPRETVRPLWHRVVALSRDPAHYTRAGVADTVEGRFDMILHVLSLTLLRMENSPALAPLTAALTEEFVTDMDGQLRENGVGDVVVGKHMGKVMGALGGRLGALRQALAAADDSLLTEAVLRNIHWNDAPDGPALAAALRQLAAAMADCSDTELRQGDIPA